jgi:hypothetical protein
MCSYSCCYVNAPTLGRVLYYTPTRREGAILQSPYPSIHTFVTDISASTGRNDFIFDIWLWHGDLYRVSPFQVHRTSTSCLPCDLQMNEWGYSLHDVACNILFLYEIILTLIFIMIFFFRPLKGH